MSKQVKNKSNWINFDPLMNLLSESDHNQLSDKVIDLYEKWQKKEVTIGFTDRKSTRLNSSHRR